MPAGVQRHPRVLHLHKIWALVLRPCNISYRTPRGISGEILTLKIRKDMLSGSNVKNDCYCSSLVLASL